MTVLKPLPQVAFQIMLALSLRPRHGYEIMQQVELDSDGRVKLGPGALYGSLKQLTDQGLVREIEQTEARRRSYELTDAGRSRLSAEIERLEVAVTLGRQRQQPGNPEAIRWAS